MPKFKVHVQQYVERVATVELEATTPDQARALFMSGHGWDDIKWEPGDDAQPARVYAIADGSDEIVWQD